MIFVLDKKDKVVGVLDNNAPHSCPYTDDFHTENIQTGVNVFEFTVPASHETASVLENEGSVIVADLDNKLNQFKIKNIEESNTDGGYFKAVYTEHVAISELLTDVVRPASLLSTTLENALKYVLDGTGYSVGEIGFLESQDVEFGEHVTVLQAIYTLAEKFKAELQFEVLFVNGVITNKLVHMEEKRGTVTKQLFTYSQDLLDVTRTENTEGLVTALIGVGQDGITLAGYQNSRDGISTELDMDYAESEEALQLYGKNGKHIFGVFTDSDSLTKVDLFNKTSEELKIRSKPKLTFKCSVATLERITGYDAKKIRVGDTINIQDYTFNPPLLLEARVLEVGRSKISPELDNVVLGDYRPLKVSTPLSLEKIQQMIAEVGAGQDGVDGVDGMDGVDGKTYYTWIRYSNSSNGANMSDSPTGMAFMGIATNKETIIPSDIATDYVWSLIKGNDGKDGANGIAGDKGSDGKTSYLHIAYATNSTGTTGFSTTDSVGKTYMGTYTDFVLADSNNPALYSWTLIKGDKGEQGSPNTTIVNAVTTIDGTGITVKDGNFGLETTQGGKHFVYEQEYSPIETKPFRNHLLTLPNMIYDHSFEMLERGLYRSVTDSFDVVTNQDIFGRWGTSGIPELFSDYQTDNTFPMIPFGEQMVRVNMTHYVKQGVSIMANQTYTLSFHVKSSPTGVKASTGEVYFKYYDAEGTVIEPTRYITFAPPTTDYYDASVRHSVSFTVPNVVSNYLNPYVEIGFRSKDTGWICYDGIQMVLGDKAVSYNPDVEAWKIRKGGMDKYPLIDALDGGHIKVNKLELSDYTFDYKASMAIVRDGVNPAHARPMMIQNIRVSVPTGNLVQNYADFTFPFSFAVAPTWVISATQDANSTVYRSAVYSPTKNSFRIYIKHVDNGIWNGNIQVQVIACGKV